MCGFTDNYPTELEWLIAYEAGEMQDNDLLTGFQRLVDNGHAWTLQGHYGHIAMALIAEGLCEAPDAGRIAKIMGAL